MRVIYSKDYDEMSRKAANIIAAQVISKPDSVLGLATGSSPIGIYKQLIKGFNAGDLDFSKCFSVNLDEYVGLDKENDQSYAYFMYHNLFKSINIKIENTNVPSGINANVEDECKRYNKLISDLGGIDIQLLGIGHNGHIGFNEPCDEFIPGTHSVELTEDTIEANKRFFAQKEDVPTRAITMGIKNIMNARKVLLIASGENKAEIIYKMVVGKITPEVPASILQLHEDSIIVADEQALSILIQKAPELIEGI